MPEISPNAEDFPQPSDSRAAWQFAVDLSIQVYRPHITSVGYVNDVLLGKRSLKRYVLPVSKSPTVLARFNFLFVTILSPGIGPNVFIPSSL